jgi:hypothetical protein
MIFIAECPFCMARVRVTDYASGSIGNCPRCTSSFTLAPADDQRLPAHVAASAGPAGASDIENESIHAPGVAAVIVKAGAAAKMPAAAETSYPSSAWEPEAARDAGSTPGAVSSRVRPEALAGAAALVLSGSALLCASFTFLCGFVAPLSGLGLLTGGAAIVLARLAPTGGLLLPITGSVASGAILNLALFLPAMLGPTYDRSRQRGDPARNILRAIPLGNGTVISDMPEWINASRYALQRGALRVQIVGVWVDPVPGKTKSKSKSGEGDPGSQTQFGNQRLQVHVRVTLVEQQSGGENKAFDWTQNRVNKPFGGTEIPNPALTDGAGKSYAFRESKVFDSVGGKRRANLFPVQTADEVFAFEAPPEGWESLRLEAPAAAWGGAGVFRFTIPATMLVSAPAGAADDKGTR